MKDLLNSSNANICDQLKWKKWSSQNQKKTCSHASLVQMIVFQNGLMPTDREIIMEIKKKLIAIGQNGLNIDNKY